MVTIRPLSEAGSIVELTSLFGKVYKSAGLSKSLASHL
jgi:hypothetical protein